MQNSKQKKTKNGEARETRKQELPNRQNKNLQQYTVKYLAQSQPKRNVQEQESKKHHLFRESSKPLLLSQTAT